MPHVHLDPFRWQPGARPRRLVLPSRRSASRQADTPQGGPPCTRLTLPDSRDYASAIPPARSRSKRAEPARTTVELVALRDDDSTREAIEKATVELNGSEVLVEIGVAGKGFGVGPAWISFGRTPQVGVRIRCPEGADLDCATASADVVTRGRLGEVEVKTASRGRCCQARRRAGPAIRERRRPRQPWSTARPGSRRSRATSGSAPSAARPKRRSSWAISRSTKRGRGPVRQDRLRRPAHRRDPRGADQAPVGLGRCPASASARVRGCASTPARRAATSAPSSTSRTSRLEGPSGAEARLQIKTVSGDVEITRAAAVSA